MKFLADAHISVEMVAMIRDLGHECIDASGIPARMPDVDVLQMAAREGRIVLTADKDFGELVFVHAIACPGIVLIRIGLPDEAARIDRVRTAWPAVVSRLPGAFITITAWSVRSRPI